MDNFQNYRHHSLPERDTFAPDLPFILPSHSVSISSFSAASVSASSLSSMFPPATVQAQHLVLPPINGLLTPISPFQPLQPLPILRMPTHNNNGSNNSNDSSDDEIPQLTTNSRILGESEAFIYYYSCKANNFVKQPVDQMYGPNGKLYIEHIPGHNIITLPKTVPIQRPARRIAQKKPAKNNSNTGLNGKPAKPNNVFIRYRCANSERIKKVFPNATQTDLSRIAAEYWRNETVEGKERFYNEYNAEYSEYTKKSKQWEIQTKQLEIMCYEEFQPQMMSMASVVVPTPAHYESSANFSGAGPINHLEFGGLPGFNQKRRRSYSMPAHRFIANRIPKQSDNKPARKRQRAYPVAEQHFN